MAHLKNNSGDQRGRIGDIKNCYTKSSVNAKGTPPSKAYRKFRLVFVDKTS